MKSYLLQPIEILPQTNITHALWWIAFGRYPTCFWDISDPETVDALYERTSYDEEPFDIPLESLSDEVCTLCGLPENVYAHYYKQNGYTVDAARAEYVNQRYVEDTTEERKREIDNEYGDFVNETLPKAAVIEKLKDAQRALADAIAKKSIKLHGVIEQDDEIPWDEDTLDFYFETEFADIAPGNIDLANQSLLQISDFYAPLAGIDGARYAFPCIDSKDLFAAVPPKPAKKIKVNYIDGIFMYQDRTNKIHPTKTLGRPRIISDEEMSAIKAYRISQDPICNGQIIKERVYDTCAWFAKTYKRNISYPTMCRILKRLNLLIKKSKYKTGLLNALILALLIFLVILIVNY